MCAQQLYFQSLGEKRRWEEMEEEKNVTTNLSQTDTIKSSHFFKINTFPGCLLCFFLDLKTYHGRPICFTPHPCWPKTQTIQLLCNQVKNKLWLTHLEENTHHLGFGQKNWVRKNQLVLKQTLGLRRMFLSQLPGHSLSCNTIFSKIFQSLPDSVSPADWVNRAPFQIQNSGPSPNS